MNVNAKHRIGKRTELELTIKPGDRQARHWDTLEPVGDYLCVSIVGGVWDRRGDDYETCGQIVETVREMFANSPRVLRICELWDRWHLNDMRSGTRAQHAALDAAEAAGNRPPPGRWYDWACETLKAAGLYEDRGYKYGHAWLVEPAPPEVAAELCRLFGIAPEVEPTPADEPAEGATDPNPDDFDWEALRAAIDADAAAGGRGIIELCGPVQEWSAAGWAAMNAAAAAAGVTLRPDPEGGVEAGRLP